MPAKPRGPRPSKKKPWFGPLSRDPPKPKPPDAYSVWMPQHRCGTAASCPKRHVFPPWHSKLPGAALRSFPPYVIADVGAIPPFAAVAEGKTLSRADAESLPAAFSGAPLKKKKGRKAKGGALEMDELQLQVIPPEQTRATEIHLRRQAREYDAFRESEAYRGMWARSLSGLPINRDTDLGDVLTAQVSMLSGETGCGKSTQIPQLLLDSLLRRRVAGSVIVAQPRRLAATSLAERVAAERGEKVGMTVGYHTGLESIPPKAHANILFCTTGVLLRKIVGDPSCLTGSHVIVDEVHERGMDSDFLLLVLRQALRDGQSGFRMTLMSATISFAPYRAYFEGFTYVEKSFHAKPHPIHQIYLDEPQDSLQAVRKEVNRGDDSWDPCAPQAVEAAVNWCIANPGVLQVSPGGAILVFLPGLNEIRGAAKLMGLRKELHVVQMYSQAPRAEYEKLFREPPPGTQKVIFATNVAESSITVEDVNVVINSGVVREASIAEDNETALLDVVRCSAASNRQRAGRAGRTSPGGVLHLFDRSTLDTLKAVPTPEITRSLLDSVVLAVFQLKHLGMADVFSALSQCMDPPDTPAIQAGINSLLDLGALRIRDGQYRMTPLGLRLSRLPVPPRTGKMLMFGAALGCIGPAMTLAAEESLSGGRALDDLPASDFKSPSVLVEKVLAFQRLELGTRGAMRTPEQRKLLRERTRVISGAVRCGLLRIESVAGLDSDGVEVHGVENRHGDNEAVLRAVLTAAWGQNLFCSGEKGAAMTADNCAARVWRGTAEQHLPAGRWGVYRSKRVASLRGLPTVVLQNAFEASPVMLATMLPRTVPVQQGGGDVAGLLVADTCPLTFPVDHAKIVEALHIRMQKVLRQHVSEDNPADFYRKTGSFVDDFACILWTEGGERHADSLPRPPSSLLAARGI